MGTLQKAQNCNILSGQTVSNAIDLFDAELEAIVTPAALTSTTFTFQASPDGINFFQVTKEDGTPYSVTVAASKYLDIPPRTLSGVRWLKIVAGSAEAADRAITVLTRLFG